MDEGLGSSTESEAGAVPLEPLAELRLGVVMTGGVSLAVWMGGVALEIDRLRRRFGIYGELCELARVRPVVDVVAGTSAGGLNGTLLACARTWSSDLEELRDVWVGLADLEQLLRDAGDATPPSLLEGDQYLLPKVDAALTRLRARGRQAGGAGPVSPPVQLTVVTTLMQAQDQVFRDSLGSRVSSPTALGLFRFSSESDGHFFEPEAPARLARAARSSASFPFAFEPSRVDGSMVGIADFVTGPDQVSWVLDGGLVMNEPMDLVYDDIRNQPASGLVRRVLCYVSPLSGAAGDDEARTAAAPPMPESPDVFDVLWGALMIPREQSIARSLRKIEDRDRRSVAVRRAWRTLGATPANASALLATAEALAPATWDARVAEVPELQRGQAGVDLASAQALALVQDLLRRALAATPEGRRDALLASRASVSAAARGAGSPPAAAAGAVGVLRDAVAALASVVDGAPEPSTPVEYLRNDLDVLLLLAGAAAPEGPTGATPTHGVLRPLDPDAVWRALLALDVLLGAAGGDLRPDPQRIDLVQISANAPNCFDGRSSAADKLTGEQLAHFGAFYRAGWRANDWMWGRLDGAYRLLQMLCDPGALDASGRDHGEIVDGLVAIATRAADDATASWLRDRFEATGGRPTLVAALAAATAEGRSAEDVERARSTIAGVLAPRAQLEIARVELPEVRDRVVQDGDSGSIVTDAGQFLRSSEGVGPASPPEAVVRAFTECTIGAERLTDDVGSDRFTATVTQAAAVGLGVVDSAVHVRATPKRRGWLAVVRAPLSVLRRVASIASVLGGRDPDTPTSFAALVVTAVVAAAGLLLVSVTADSTPALSWLLAAVLVAVAVVAFLRQMASKAARRAVLVVVGVMVVGLVVALVGTGQDWFWAVASGGVALLLSAGALARLALPTGKGPTRTSGPG